MDRRFTALAGRCLCMLGGACWLLCCYLLPLHVIGTREGLYYRLQTEAGVLDSAGISDSALRRLDGVLADCLRGDADWYARAGEETVFGVRQPAFNAREQAHMEDCRRLFSLLRTALAALMPVGGALLAGGAACLGSRQRFRRAVLCSPLVILLPLGGFAAWAAADFDSAFTLFHRLLFSNDLWLLDPRTDLLIRLCPESMFMRMGFWIFILGTIAAAVLLTAAVWLTRKRGIQHANA